MSDINSAILKTNAKAFGYELHPAGTRERIAALEAERDVLDADLHNERNDHQKTMGALHMQRLAARAWKQAAKRQRMIAGANAKLAATMVVRGASPDYIPKEVRDALNHAGEWIANASIAVEPGWQGSQADILREIETALTPLPFEDAQTSDHAPDDLDELTGFPLFEALVSRCTMVK